MRVKSSKVVLVTGFAPFGGERINPSWEIARALPDALADHRIERLRVPTEFGQSIDTVTRAIDRLKPNLVLCLGQAGGRSRMTLERVAVNVSDAVIPDNAGVQLIDTPIRADGPAGLFATLPIKAMVEAMARAGIPAEVSNTAGTFVCNHLMYGVLYHLAARAENASKVNIRAGFMHVPFMESQIVDRANTPGLSLATMVDGVKAAIIAAIKNRADRKLVGGALH
jgi:pyroglutamyl-peptidase